MGYSNWMLKSQKFQPHNMTRYDSQKIGMNETSDSYFNLTRTLLVGFLSHHIHPHHITRVDLTQKKRINETSDSYFNLTRTVLGFPVTSHTSPPHNKRIFESKEKDQ